MKKEIVMIFRRARISDIPKIIKVIKNERALRGYVREYTKEMLKQAIKNKDRATYVFAGDGNIAAFLEVRLEHMQRRAYLETIIVARRYRRKGIGSLLVNQIEKIAKNRKCKNVSFLSRVNNVAMNFLARKRGYRQKGEFIFWEKEL